MHIEFALQYAMRRDNEAKVYVAYIPMLGLYSQSKSKSRLKKSVNDLVLNFVRICHERGILDDTMRERGLTRMAAADKERAKKLGKARKAQYIMVGKAERERELYEVPITLLAGKQAMAECRP